MATTISEGPRSRTRSEVSAEGHGSRVGRRGSHRRRAQRDYVVAGRGDDTIHGGAGSDGIPGLTGADVIFGGAGPNGLLDGPGTDTIYGGLGHDLVFLAQDKLPTP